MLIVVGAPVGFKVKYTQNNERRISPNRQLNGATLAFTLKLLVDFPFVTTFVIFVAATMLQYTINSTAATSNGYYYFHFFSSFLFFFIFVFEAIQNTFMYAYDVDDDCMIILYVYVIFFSLIFL